MSPSLRRLRIIEPVGVEKSITNRCDQKAKEENIVSYKVGIVIEKDESGYYAYSPELEDARPREIP